MANRPPVQIPASHSLRHGRALRRGRYSAPAHTYLLTTVTHARRPLFADFDAGCMVARTLAHHHHSGRGQTLAWVLMPDHLHWLVTLGETHTLAEAMRAVKSYVARRLNERDRCSGRRVWQAGFHDHAVRRDEDLRKLARYVIANPLRAGLVEQVGDYPFWDAAFL
ncbi:MAG: REP-associated tyrosine transposase [Gammaproteobacteria bacterium]